MRDVQRRNFLFEAQCPRHNIQVENHEKQIVRSYAYSRKGPGMGFPKRSVGIQHGILRVTKTWTPWIRTPRLRPLRKEACVKFPFPWPHKRSHTLAYTHAYTNTHTAHSMCLRDYHFCRLYLYIGRNTIRKL